MMIRLIEVELEEVLMRMMIRLIEEELEEVLMRMLPFRLSAYTIRRICRRK